MEVVYGGGFNDKTLRELIVLERNGKLIVRRIRRKFTSTLSFKEKYPEASVVDYTRNQHTLLSWIKMIDWNLTNPNTCPMPTFLFEGKRYYFNRVSGQWWDLPTNKYWNSRLSDLLAYDDDRKFKVSLELDASREQVLLLLKQKNLEVRPEPCSIVVYRNNDVIYRERFTFDQLMLEYRLSPDNVSLNQVIPIDKLDNKKPHDIYCVLVNSKASFFDYRGRFGLYSSIPKFLLFGMEEYEKKLGEPYIHKHLIGF